MIYRGMLCAILGCNLIGSRWIFVRNVIGVERQNRSWIMEFHFRSPPPVLIQVWRLICGLKIFFANKWNFKFSERLIKISSSRWWQIKWNSKHFPSNLFLWCKKNVLKRSGNTAATKIIVALIASKKMSINRQRRKESQNKEPKKKFWVFRAKLKEKIHD